MVNPSRRPTNTTPNKTLILSKTDRSNKRFRYAKRDPEIVRPQKQQIFKLCRMPDRSSGLAHVKLAVTHLPPRPDWDDGFPLQSGCTLRERSTLRRLTASWYWACGQTRGDIGEP